MLKSRVGLITAELRSYLFFCEPSFHEAVELFRLPLEIEVPAPETRIDLNDRLLSGHVIKLSFKSESSSLKSFGFKVLPSKLCFCVVFYAGVFSLTEPDFSGFLISGGLVADLDSSRTPV
jgi:hypothetical protein